MNHYNDHKLAIDIETSQISSGSHPSLFRKPPLPCLHTSMFSNTFVTDIETSQIYIFRKPPLPCLYTSMFSNTFVY